MNKKELQNIYDYSKSKQELCKKLGIRLNQNGCNLNKDILNILSEIGITEYQISGKYIRNHYLEIQKRDYDLNPKYCEYCGKKLPFEKKFAKCCNQSCGSALGNKKKGKRSEETKQKISKTFSEGIKNHKYVLANQYGTYLYGDENIHKYIHKVICEYCGNEFETYSQSKYCSDECRKKSLHNKLSNAVKQKIKNGTFQGWKSRNIASYAEKFWKQVLDNNNIQYIKEKLIEYGESNKGERYFLDFYIENNNRKIDLEIDGKQHQYEDRKKSDIKRDKFISLLGIEVYRIPWNEINSEKGKQQMKEKINKFLKYLGV